MSALTYKPTARCPKCRRCPNVRYSASDVDHAKLERQSARKHSVACLRCGTRYWIRAKDIANATVEVPADAPRKRAALDAPARAGVA